MTRATSPISGRSVRLVVVAGLVAIVAVALGLVTWRSFVFARSLLAEQASENMAQAVAGAGARLDASIAARLDAVRTVAQNPVVIAAARGDSASFGEARRTIEALLLLDPVHNEVAAIVDTLRTVRVATDGTADLGGGRPVRDLAYPILIAYPDSAGYVASMAFLASVRDADGHQIGVLGLRTRVTALTQVLGDVAGEQLVNQLLRVRQVAGPVVASWPLPTAGKVGPRPQPWEELPANARLLDETTRANRVRERRIEHGQSQDILRESSIRLASVPWYVSSVADVAQVDSIIAAAQQCLATQGLPDVVVASAGISVGMDTHHRADLDVMREVFAINNLGMAATFHPFLPGMRQRRSGTLVGIASIAAIRGLPGHGAYCASKAGVVAYCESLRGECRGDGLRVVTLLPGYIATPLTARNPYAMPFLMSADDFAERAQRAIAAGRSYVVIPWQMGVVAKLMRALPNAWYDRLAAGRGRKPRRSGGSPT